MGTMLHSSSAADLKSLTHSRQNRVQRLQIESGTGIMDFLAPITFRSPRTGVAATMERQLRKVGTCERVHLTLTVGLIAACLANVMLVCAWL
jgi:hypothetical protein